MDFWINPVFIECANDVGAVKLVVRFLAYVHKKLPDDFSLGVGEQSEVAGVIMGLCKAEGHPELVSAVQIGNEVSRQMEPHPLGVEKGETAVTPIKFAHWNASPILLLVAGAVTSAHSFVLIVINPLRLLEPNAAAQRDTGKRFSDFIAEAYIHYVSRRPDFHDQVLALQGIAVLHEDFIHDPVCRGVNGGLHLHRLECQ